MLHLSLVQIRSCRDMAFLPQIICLVLVLITSQKTAASTGTDNIFTVEKCLNISKRLSKSLTEALSSLEGYTKKIEGEDCLDLKNKGVRKSGIYTIHPGGISMKVYCDMTTDGGGWTVIQRRVNDLVDFYRGWTEYEDGFGNLEDNLWLGLKNIHTLTSFSKNTSSVRFDMWIPKAHRYETYSNFKVGDANSEYLLTVTGASGTAGDSMKDHHNGRKFTTKDRDNDVWKGNCAVEFKGAWWYGGCHHANLNALYLNGDNKVYASGIIWWTWKGHLYSLQKVEMKIRRNE